MLTVGTVCTFAPSLPGVNSVARSSRSPAVRICLRARCASAAERNTPVMVFIVITFRANHHPTPSRPWSWMFSSPGKVVAHGSIGLQPLHTRIPCLPSTPIPPTLLLTSRTFAHSVGRNNPAMARSLLDDSLPFYMRPCIRLRATCHPSNAPEDSLGTDDHNSH